MEHQWAPISPIISDIVIQDLEISCLSQIDFHIPIYLRCVDTFSIIPANKIEFLVTLFNSYDGRLSFTYEIENNNSLSFLNINPVRNETLFNERVIYSLWNDKNKSI